MELGDMDEELLLLSLWSSGDYRECPDDSAWSQAGQALRAAELPGEGGPGVELGEEGGHTGQQHGSGHGNKIIN